MEKKSVEAIAKEMAKRKSQETIEEQQETVKIKQSSKRKSDLTSFEDLMEGYQTGIVVLTSTFPDGRKKAFEIQVVGPGDYIGIIGSPIVKRLTKNIVDLDDEEAVKVAIDNLANDTDDLELRFETVKGVVCAGVISVNFVNKSQYECRGNEISINRLSQQDLLELYNAITQLSNPVEDEDTVDNFRGEGDEGSSTEDTQDSESIQSETESDTVSEQQES